MQHGDAHGKRRPAPKEDTFVAEGDQLDFSVLPGLAGDEFSRHFGGKQRLKERTLDPVFPTSVKSVEDTIAAVGKSVRGRVYGITAAKSSPQGAPSYRIVSQPLGEELVVPRPKVRFYRLRGTSFNLPFDGAFLPLRGGDAILPVMGSFYLKGKKVAGHTLAAIGVERVLDAEGKTVSYPLLASGTGRLVGGRVSTMPAQGIAQPAAATDKGLRPITETAELEALAAKHGIDTERLKTFARKRSPWPELEERAYIRALARRLKRKKAITFIQGFALQFKGNGTEYKGRPVPLSERGRPIGKKRRERILKSEADSPELRGGAIIGDPRLLGRWGVFLDLHYQSTRSPLGATKESELTSIDRDRRLLENGAILSTLALGGTRMLSRHQLDLLGAPSGVGESYAAVRMLLDDNRALDHFMFNPVIYPFFLKDAYPCRSHDEARDEHLGRLSRTIGTNCRALLDAGLTLRPGYNSWIRDLSVYGGIRDSEEFRDVAHPLQGGRLLEQALGDSRAVGAPDKVGGLTTIASLGGYPLKGFYRSPHARSFFTGFLEGRDGAAVHDYAGRQADRVGDTKTEERLLTSRVIGQMLAKRFAAQDISVEGLSRAGLVDLLLGEGSDFSETLRIRGRPVEAEELLSLEGRLSAGRLTLKDKVKFDVLLLALNSEESHRHGAAMTYRVFDDDL